MALRRVKERARVMWVIVLRPNIVYLRRVGDAQKPDNEATGARRLVPARHGGRHDIFKHPDSIEIISVPRHQTLTPGVARKIAKAAGWTERRKR